MIKPIFFDTSALMKNGTLVTLVVSGHGVGNTCTTVNNMI